MWKGEKKKLFKDMNHHTTARSLNRINQQKGCKVKLRHQLNTRPGLLNNFILFPSINNCLMNPLYLVNLNCNNVLLDMNNLVTLPINQKYKVNEPLLTLTPFLCFFLSPLHTGVNNRVNMDYYYRYLCRTYSFFFCPSYQRYCYYFRMW